MNQVWLLLERSSDMEDVCIVVWIRTAFYSLPYSLREPRKAAFFRGKPHGFNDTTDAIFMIG